MRRLIALVCAALLIAPQTVMAQQRGGTPPRAQQGAPEAAGAKTERTGKLPVRRVVLYKTGVGYFEHVGRIRGNQDTSIEFTSGQLNDVLKSLTILDLGGGRITGVSYNSEAPLEQRLSKLRLPLGTETTVAQFLNALRGARIEVRSGAGVVAGRLLSVERKTRPSKEGPAAIVDEVSLVTDAGEVRTADLGPGVSVRVAERDLNEEIGRYLGLLASTREQDLRRMVISTAGTGERQLFVSYISEVPVWKTTYRLVLPAKAGAKPLLQGWAIVDNTVGEDWEDVELSLVAGAPQSFIQQLSQPYYSRRPVVPLPQSVQLTPQTHQATLVGGTGRLVGQVTDVSGAGIPGARVQVQDAAGQVVAQATTGGDGRYEVRGLSPGSYSISFETPGFNTTRYSDVGVSAGDETEQDVEMQVASISQEITVEAGKNEFRTRTGSAGPGRGLGGVGGIPGGYVAAQPVPPPPPMSRNDALERMVAAAQGRELGDLFEYKLKERVTIRKNQSALVPIIQTEITAEKVSLWNENSGIARPLRAVWLTNSSTLTLDGGSFNVIEGDAFAGEGLTEPLKPGEKRLLSYAADLGVNVDTKRESERQRVTRVRIVRGIMTHTSEEREKKTYTIRNEDTQPRTVVIEHPVRAEWKLAGGPEPTETSAGWHRFRVQVEPKKTATLTINEVHPLETRYQITTLNDEQIGIFLRQRSINPEVEAALRRIVGQKNLVAGIDSQIRDRQQQIQRIFEDQARVRENMKSLKGSPEEKALIQRYTQQLGDQETRLDTLRKEIADLEVKKQQAQAELDRMVQELVLDVNL